MKTTFSVFKLVIVSAECHIYHITYISKSKVAVGDKMAGRNTAPCHNTQGG